MKVIIDRFEGDYAIVEIGVGKTEKIPKILIPNAKEKDVVSIEIDKQATEARQKQIQMLMKEAFEEEE